MRNAGSACNMASQTLPTPTASVELLNNNDGVTLHPDHNASHNITYPAPHHASSKPSGSTSGSYWDSEDDSDMSEHAGGVALDDSWAGMTMAHAQQLNAEMDVIDAEVMGPYNVAAVAMTSSIQIPSNNPYEDDSTFSGPDDEMLDVQQLAWFADSMFEEGDGSGQYGAASVDHPSAMAQLSQHLPILQDGQAQGNLAQTTNFQGVHINMEDQHNLSMAEFLYSWSVTSTYGDPRNPKKRKRGPNLGYIDEMRRDKPMEIRRSHLQGDRCDFQGIDWKRLEVTRDETRRARQRTYRSYVNIEPPLHHRETLRRCRIDDSQNYFRFRRMDFTQKLHYSHFQLRNLVASTSRNSVFYAGESCLYHTNPLMNENSGSNPDHACRQYSGDGQKVIKMDLTDPVVQPLHGTGYNGIMISTLAAKHNVLVAGGFGGEYGMMALDTEGTEHTEGLITNNFNPITNHIDINLNRQSGLPQVIFASNDSGFRVLDCTTEKFVSENKYGFALNCTALSSDSRLRVAVGDTKNVLILNAETGAVLQELDGHEDFGFACAWADNGWHVATGNQDKLVKIWDARMWTDRHGRGKPIKTISSCIAGVRSLNFSPLGSGKRVLVAAEQADVVSLIDAETYTTKQSLDFYGEVLGTSFTPDGQELFVGVHDSMRGGLMEFERCGYGELYEGRRSRFDKSRRIYDTVDPEDDDRYHSMSAGFDWKPTLKETIAHPKSKRTATWHQRRPCNLGDLALF